MQSFKLYIYIEFMYRLLRDGVVTLLFPSGIINLSIVFISCGGFISVY